MSSIVGIYTSAVRDNLKPLYANWEPGKPVELGDYGLLSGDVFVHLGNVGDLGIKFGVRNDSSTDRKYFASARSTEVRLNAKGATNLSSVLSAKATLEIHFGSKEGVFFNAAECQFSMIQDKSEIGREIMLRYNSGDWDRGWAVVTDLVRTGAATIAVSGGDQASVVFEATGNVEKINLADASIGLSVATQKNVGYVVEAEKGIVPLIGLSKIQSAFLWSGDSYKPLSAAYDEKILSTMRRSPGIRTEESPADLYFGQLK